MTADRPLDGGYVWPSSPLDVAWGQRFRDLGRLRAFADAMADGPHRDFVQAFLVYRDGRLDEALRAVERLQDQAPFDVLWSARLDFMHGGLLHAVGLPAQSLEMRERGLVKARASGNPNAVILGLHDRAVVLERTDGVRTQASYVQVVDLIDAMTDAPAYARAELDALRALAIVNLHLFSDRTDLPLPAGVPALEETQEFAREIWPDLSAAVQAFRGLCAYGEGDHDAARTILDGLPDPLTMQGGDHAVMVATGVATRLGIEGRYAEAIEMLDAAAATVSPQFLHEVLEVKAGIYERMGDFEKAYRVAREVNAKLQGIYGEEARAAVRALEVFYRTDEHRSDADSARRESAVIAEQAEEWRQGSLRDPLTDVWNRRYLRRRLEELDGTAGHQIAVLDLDRFKQVNDEFGHAAGDHVLVHVARVIRDACADDDVCVRHGGDEFCVLRPAGAPGRLADDLAAACHPGPAPEGPFEVTLSIGVVEVGPDGVEAAFARADEAMYDVKRSGGAGLAEADPGKPLSEARFASRKPAVPHAAPGPVTPGPPR